MSLQCLQGCCWCCCCHFLGDKYGQRIACHRDRRRRKVTTCRALLPLHCDAHTRVWLVWFTARSAPLPSAAPGSRRKCGGAAMTAATHTYDSFWESQMITQHAAQRARRVALDAHGAARTQRRFNSPRVDLPALPAPHLCSYPDTPVIIVIDLIPVRRGQKEESELPPIDRSAAKNEPGTAAIYVCAGLK